jgi:hypothetical protein
MPLAKTTNWTNIFTGAGQLFKLNDVDTGDAMSSIEELLKEKEAIEAKIVEQRRLGRDDALVTVKKLIKEYEMTATELKGVIKKRKPRSTTKSGITKRIPAKKTTAAKPRAKK